MRIHSSIKRLLAMFSLVAIVAVAFATPAEAFAVPSPTFTLSGRTADPDDRLRDA